MVQKGLKRSKPMIDEEYEFLSDRAYIDAERYERETILMQELFEQEQKAKVELGKVRKRSKFDAHGRKKLPRIVRIQLNNRRLQAATEVWNRSESSFCVRVS